MTLASLCTFCNTITALYVVPPYVWDLLGSHVVVTPQALKIIKPTLNIPHFVISKTNIINKEITGAIVAGEGLLLGLQFTWLSHQRGWYPRAAVLVLANKLDPNVFSVLWSKRIANVLILTRTDMYAYNPFTASIMSVGEHVQKNLTDRWKDMKGSKVPISVYDNPISYIADIGVSLGSGLDGSALYELSRYWNMTPDLTVNDKSNESERQVLQERTDLSFTGHSLFQRYFGLRFSSVIYGDRVCIIVKIPDKLRGWHVLLRIYDWKVYIVFFVTLIVTNKALRLVTMKKTRKNTIQMVVRTMSNIPVVRPPTAFRERIILGSTMLFGLIIVTVYQASMFHFVRHNVRLPKLKTLLDVFKSEIPLRSNEIALKDFFVPWDKKEIRKLGKRIKEQKNIQRALSFAGVVISEKYYHLLRDANLLRKDIYVVKERVGSYTMAYSVKKGSPFQEPLTNFTMRIFEAGLYRKWRRMTFYKVGRFHDTEEITPSKRGLHFSDTEVAFVVLLIGHGIAFLVFLLELLVKHRSRIRVQAVWRFLKNMFNMIFC